jgi:hypothetical protein
MRREKCQQDFEPPKLEQIAWNAVPWQRGSLPMKKQWDATKIPFLRFKGEVNLLGR